MFWCIRRLWTSDLMLEQFMFGFKILWTILTMIHFVHTVNGSHMGFQVRQLRKCRLTILTYRAFERFFASMFTDVQFQYARMGKCLPANLWIQIGKRTIEQTIFKKYTMLWTWHLWMLWVLAETHQLEIMTIYSWHLYMNVRCVWLINKINTFMSGPFALVFVTWWIVL